MFTTDECQKCGRELKSRAYQMCRQQPCWAQDEVAAQTKDGERMQGILDARDVMVWRAADVARVYDINCAELEFANLFIDGAVAQLRWPEAHLGYYEALSIEAQSFKFPVRLLTLSSDDFEAWMTEARQRRK